jgi:nicotinamide-nucleotide amidase
MIESISIGNEIISGSVADANFAFLAARLADSGLRISKHTAVGDGLEDMVDAFAQARGRLVAVCGGLGPTEDDRTRDAAERYFRAKLRLNTREMARIKRRFASLGFYMPVSNQRQAMFPKGAKILVNPAGTASGFVMEKSGRSFFFFPGVPKEYRIMIDKYFMPQARKLAKGAVAAAAFRFFGISESGLEERIGPAEKLGSWVEVAYLPCFPQIMVKVRASGKSTKAARAALEKAVCAIRAAAGEFIFSEDEAGTMENTVGELLRKTGMKLAVAESCTGGLVAHMITAIPGSSEYFLEGTVCYSNRAKVRLLGVQESTLETHGAVSAECAREMADGARTRGGADIAVSITGIAGPGGGSESKPVGTVFIGISEPGSCEAREFHFNMRDRSQVKLVSAYAALELVRRRAAQRLSSSGKYNG